MLLRICSAGRATAAAALRSSSSAAATSLNGIGHRSASSSTAAASASDGGADGDPTASRFASGAAAAVAAALLAAGLVYGSDRATGQQGLQQQRLAPVRCASGTYGGAHATYEEDKQQRRRRRRIVTPVERFDSGGGGGAELKRPASAADAGDSRSLHKSALTRSAPAALPLAAATAAAAKQQPQPAAASTSAEPLQTQSSGGATVTMSDRTGLPCRVPYLIVGSGFAGMAAARAIRASDPMSKVLMIGDEPYPPYLRPPLSKELWRRKDDRVKSMLSPLGDMRRNSWLFVEPDSFFIEPRRLHQADTGGVSLWKGSRVVAIDVADKCVTLDSGDRIHYGRCLLATGGRPRTLPVFDAAGAQSPEIASRTVAFRGIDDFKALRERATRAKSVVVIGGGFLGCELAVSLAEVSKKTGLKVHQVFKEPGALANVLPPYLAEHTASFIGGCGVTQYPGEQVTSVAWEPDAGGSIRVGLSSGRELSADLAVVAVGIQPNTQLADAAGLEVDPTEGGFLVNAELEARADLFAAGDACSYYDLLLGRRRVEHVNHAEESGTVAGRNMAAGPDSTERVTYQHQSSFWCNLANSLAWDAVGLVDASLQTQAFFAMPPEDKPDSAAYQCPGVVFYIKAGRVVGILLWNLPDEIFQDKKAFAPSRLNLARKVLAERQLADPAALQVLAKEFDVYQSIDEDYQDLKKYMQAKEEQEAAAAAGKEGATSAASSAPADGATAAVPA